MAMFQRLIEIFLNIGLVIKTILINWLKFVRSRLRFLPDGNDARALQQLSLFPKATNVYIPKTYAVWRPYNHITIPLSPSNKAIATTTTTTGARIRWMFPFDVYADDGHPSNHHIDTGRGCACLCRWMMSVSERDWGACQLHHRIVTRWTWLRQQVHEKGLD